MKTDLIICTILATACAKDPKMFTAGYDDGGSKIDTETGELEASDTDTGEFELLDTDTDTDEFELLDTDTDTDEFELLDTDTDQLDPLDSGTADLDPLDTDTGPPWVCDFNGEGCAYWQKCATETISICPLSQDPIPISAINYGIEWLVCRDNRCPTNLPHRDCRDVSVIGTRCLP